MIKTVNKTELIDKVASLTGVSKVNASDIVNATLRAIVEFLAEGNRVTLVGFGTFNVADRPERTGRNPQTGETIKIAAQKTPRFSAGKQLKEACNVKKKDKK